MLLGCAIGTNWIVVGEEEFDDRHVETVALRSLVMHRELIEVSLNL